MNVQSKKVTFVVQMRWWDMNPKLNLGVVHKRRRQLGGRGQKLVKIAKVVYGWSLSMITIRTTFFFFKIILSDFRRTSEASKIDRFKN